MDILQFAIQMEKDGEQYYQQQAAKNEGNALQTIFLSLAKDEAKHAKLLISKTADEPYVLEPQAELSSQLSLFYESPDFQSAVKEMPDQAALYHEALELEKRSINLYQDLLTKVGDAASKELFTFLIGEEQYHFNILEEMYRHVNRPNDWVEAAEFGVREEY